ncbi:hypothetical protein LJK88_38560 [Paenibacillus sp. P26]|nr:hypothetical protein LJK88_38560 [Paenibacillus sp. P26]
MSNETNVSQDWLQSVRWNSLKDQLDLLDQRLLPDEIVYLELTTSEEVWDAIKQLAVRGRRRSASPRRSGYTSVCGP